MKRFVLALMVVGLIPALMLGATLSGVVSDSAGTAIVNARVNVMSDPMHGHPGDGYRAWTDESGTYLIEGIEAGVYEVIAGARGFDMAHLPIEFTEDAAVVQDFTLFLHHGGGGGGPGDGPFDHPWEIVELTGTTMIDVRGDRQLFLLDTDDVPGPNFVLGFGPPDYIPESDVALPEEGDVIEITGGLMLRGHHPVDMPLVIVFELNDQPWFTPDSSGHHNGHGGWWHRHHGCEFGDPVLVDVEGNAMVILDRQDHERFALNVDDTPEPEFRLDFGRDDYDPGNGAARPVDGDFVEITGGLINGCPIHATIVVYEINGMFWREPGDTTGLGPQQTTAVGDEQVLQPSSHLVVDAYPNPFNPTTTVSVTLPSAGEVSIRVFDLAGRQVAELAQGTFAAGQHRFVLDGTALASGSYFVKVQSTTAQSIRRVQLVK
ncbi:carboxypeptidase regulatory-like domain-containing protein [bacterium]|nr:carboxypeptidase regulatory-like domain-containing protein [bacterium]